VAERIAPELIETARDRLADIEARIAAACARTGRDPGEVHVIGASKRQPIERIAAAVCAGLVWLGENYVQEARDKRAELTARLAAHYSDDDSEHLAEPLAERLSEQPTQQPTQEQAAGPAAGHPGSPTGSRIPTPRWRLIGNLQRNKAKQAVECFEAIDTLDRAALAEALDRRAASAGVRLDLCAQVNVSGEPQKAGISESELPELLAACRPLEHVKVVGLMAVPAASPDLEERRRAFSRLRALRDTLRSAPGGEHLKELNMGMSGDYEVAVEEGATWVRIGTALFGSRPSA